MATKAATKPKPKKKKLKAKPFDAAAYWTDHQLVTNKTVTEMQEEIDKLKESMDCIKEQYKGKKAEWEAERASLSVYIRQRSKEFKSKVVQPTLTANVEHSEDAAKAKQIIGEVAAGTVLPSDKSSDSSQYDRHGVHSEAWKQYPIANLTKFGLPPAVVNALASPKLKRGADQISPITKMGHMAAFIAPWPDNPSFSRKLVDLKGIGPEAATKYSDAELKFWGEWERGTISVEFVKELAAKDTAFALLYREPGKEPAAKPLRGGGAKPEKKPRVRNRSKPKPEATAEAKPDEAAEVDTPYQQGEKAYFAGKQRLENPYDADSDTENSEKWLDGWAAGDLQTAGDQPNVQPKLQTTGE